MKEGTQKGGTEYSGIEEDGAASGATEGVTCTGSKVEGGISLLRALLTDASTLVLNEASSLACIASNIAIISSPTDGGAAQVL